MRKLNSLQIFERLSSGRRQEGGRCQPGAGKTFLTISTAQQGNQISLGGRGMLPSTTRSIQGGPQRSIPTTVVPIYYPHRDLRAKKHHANDKILVANNSESKAENNWLHATSQEARGMSGMVWFIEHARKDFQEKEALLSEDTTE